MSWKESNLLIIVIESETLVYLEYILWYKMNGLFLYLYASLIDK